MDDKQKKEFELGKARFDWMKGQLKNGGEFRKPPDNLQLDLRGELEKEFDNLPSDPADKPYAW